MIDTDGGGVAGRFHSNAIENVTFFDFSGASCYAPMPSIYEDNFIIY